METIVETTSKFTITLADDQVFQVRAAPGAIGRRWFLPKAVVRAVVVQWGHFSLYGDLVSGIDRAYTNVGNFHNPDDVPGLSTALRLEIIRVLGLARQPQYQQVTATV